MRERMTLLAYAKLNLSLRVLGKREDGFHEILSLVQTIDLADRIELARCGSGIRVENDLVGLVGQDLAERAAIDVLRAKGVHAGCSIRIRKSIPAGGGLGGGSSDAASVIYGIDQLIPPSLPTGGAADIAAGIGSDVPLFLLGGRVRVSGRGERTAPVEGPPEGAFVVVVPPIHCDTGAVYRGWSARGAVDRPRGTASLDLGENDLLQPALALAPALARYLAAVRDAGGEYSGMSGSGSSFYSAYRREEDAGGAARALETMFPEARVFCCRPVSAGFRVCQEDQ